MTTVQVISRGVTWNVISTIGVKLISFGTLFVILRELTLYQYGQVELTLASITTVSLFALPAIVAVAVADIGVEIGKKDFARTKGLFLSFARLHTSLGLLTFIVVAAVVYFFGAFFFGQASTSLFLVALLLVLTGTVRNCVTTLLQLHLAFRAQSLFSISEEVIKCLTILVLVLIFHLGPYAVVLAIICSQALTQMLFVPFVWGLYQKWGPSEATVISLIQFLTPHARWSILTGFASTFSQTMRPWLVKVLLGTEAVALFSVTFGLLSQLTALVPIQDVLSPILPQALVDSARFRLLLEKGMRYQFIAYVIAGIGALITFPVIVHFFFPKYQPVLPLFRVLLLAIIPMSFDLFSPIFLALKAQKNMFFATLGKILFYSICLPVGAWLGGLTGLVLGFVVATSLYIYERYRVVQRIVPGFRVVFWDFFVFDQYDTMLLNMLKRRFLAMIAIFT
jgi:O-antigen/teichoic acid export membrane protein